MFYLSNEDTEKSDSHIKGVEFKSLRSFPDDRGFFREVVRKTDPFFEEGFAQWSHSKMGHNTVKAWHFHHNQVDWWYCGLGVLHTALIDMREDSPTFKNKIEFKLGETEEDPEALSAVVKIPQGVFHGCKVLSKFAHLFYITSETYNPDDEGRFPFNSEEVDHSWGNESELTVADNDKRKFIPPHPRQGMFAQV